jgi:hypothetical protein
MNCVAAISGIMNSYVQRKCELMDDKYLVSLLPRMSTRRKDYEL